MSKKEVARSDDMEILRLRQENASLNQLFNERADHTASLLEERARLRALNEHICKTLDELVHLLRRSREP